MTITTCASKRRANVKTDMKFTRLSKYLTKNICQMFYQRFARTKNIPMDQCNDLKKLPYTSDMHSVTNIYKMENNQSMKTNVEGLDISISKFSCFVLKVFSFVILWKFLNQPFVVQITQRVHSRKYPRVTLSKASGSLKCSSISR